MLKRFGYWVWDWLPVILSVLALIGIIIGGFYGLYISAERSIEEDKVRCEIYMEENSDQYIFWQKPNCVKFENNRFTLIDLGVYYGD